MPEKPGALSPFSVDNYIVMLLGYLRNFQVVLYDVALPFQNERPGAVTVFRAALDKCFKKCCLDHVPPPGSLFSSSVFRQSGSSDPDSKNTSPSTPAGIPEFRHLLFQAESKLGNSFDIRHDTARLGCISLDQLARLLDKCHYCSGRLTFGKRGVVELSNAIVIFLQTFRIEINPLYLLLNGHRDPPGQIFHSVECRDHQAAAQVLLLNGFRNLLDPLNVFCRLLADQLTSVCLLISSRNNLSYHIQHLGSAVPDLAERFVGIGCNPYTLGCLILADAYILVHADGLFADIFQQAVNLPGRLCGTMSEVAHFLRHHGKGLAALSGLGGDD